LNNVLSRRRTPVIVRRADAERPNRRAGSRRGARRLRATPTRAAVVASTVLLVATLAWVLTFAYLVTVVH
jgi:hypothetical protein